MCTFWAILWSFRFCLWPPGDYIHRVHLGSWQARDCKPEASSPLEISGKQKTSLLCNVFGCKGKESYSRATCDKLSCEDAASTSYLCYEFTRRSPLLSSSTNTDLPYRDSVRMETTYENALWTLESTIINAKYDGREYFMFLSLGWSGISFVCVCVPLSLLTHASILWEDAWSTNLGVKRPAKMLTMENVV